MLNLLYGRQRRPASSLAEYLLIRCGAAPRHILQKGRHVAASPCLELDRMPTNVALRIPIHTSAHVAQVWRARRHIMTLPALPSGQLLHTSMTHNNSPSPHRPAGVIKAIKLQVRARFKQIQMQSRTDNTCKDETMPTAGMAAQLKSKGKYSSDLELLGEIGIIPINFVQ